jgi:hypothetical protein
VACPPLRSLGKKDSDGEQHEDRRRCEQVVGSRSTWLAINGGVVENVERSDSGRDGQEARFAPRNRM